jgi:hypothetical protein
MFAQRRLCSWTLAVTFALCIAAVPLAHRLLHSHSATPRTLTELTEQLRRAGLVLYAVPMLDSFPEQGIYLCERPLPREQLQRLHRFSEQGDRWQGIVFCEFSHRLGGELADEVWRCWGEYGLQIGPFVLFGDPALLRRIRQAIPELSCSSPFPSSPIFANFP